MEFPEPFAQHLVKGASVSSYKLFNRVRLAPRSVVLPARGTGKDTFSVSKEGEPGADFIDD